MNSSKKELSLKETHLLFLQIFPWKEIDHREIRQVCRTYQRDLCSEDSALTLFSKHSDYFENFTMNNRFVNYLLSKEEE